MFLGVPNFNQRRLDEILEDIDDVDEVSGILINLLIYSFIYFVS